MRLMVVSRLWGALVAVSFCAGFACINPQSDPHIAQIQQLQDKINEQGRLLALRDEQAAENARTVQELRTLGGEKRLDQLVHVSRIAIERLSGGYDDDRNGSTDGVVIYLSLFDQDGEVIKAAGSAAVRVYDLSKPDGAQMIATGNWTAEQMRSLWYGQLMTSHYTLKLPWPAGTAKAAPKAVTAVVQFVDLLSGKSFEAQQSLNLQVGDASSDEPVIKTITKQP